MIDLTWRIGGPQGAGVDTAGELFARALAAGGYWVALRREYHSNIMGRHSYLDVRVGDAPRPGFRERVDLLAALDGETLVRHLDQVRPGGRVLFDPAVLKEPIDRLSMLDPPARARARARLGEGARVEAALAFLREHGAEAVPLSVAELLEGADPRARNTLLVAASLRLLGLSPEPLTAALSALFGGRRERLEANLRLVERVYTALPPPRTPALRPLPEPGPRVWLSGSEASAIGKVASGLGFMSYYPITPATDEPFYLEAHPEAGVRVVQVEDELAAVNMALGAAAAGVPASLTTSGPGFSLMAEALSFAGMTETPLVVTLYQRGGPSTGLPTRQEQADLLFALAAGHGEFPRAVLASATVEGMAEDAALAMAIAWRFQLPVIHLADKHLAQTRKTLPPPPLAALPEAAPKRPAGAEGVFPRYRLGEADGVSPFLPVGSEGAHYWITSDEHDEYGHITEDPELRVAMMEKRLKKLEALRAYLPPERTFRVLNPEAPTLVVGWGSVYEAAVAALEGVPELGYLHLFFLEPFPEVAGLLAGKRVATLEQNATGQLAPLLRARTGVEATHRIVKFNGRPIVLEELLEAFQALAAGDAPRRQVLRAGV